LRSCQINLHSQLEWPSERIESDGLLLDISADVDAGSSSRVAAPVIELRRIRMVTAVGEPEYGA
jgi:hypothetical protein